MELELLFSPGTAWLFQESMNCMHPLWVHTIHRPWGSPMKWQSGSLRHPCWLVHCSPSHWGPSWLGNWHVGWPQPTFFPLCDSVWIQCKVDSAGWIYVLSGYIIQHTYCLRCALYIGLTVHILTMVAESLLNKQSETKLSSLVDPDLIPHTIGEYWGSRGWIHASQFFSIATFRKKKLFKPCTITWIYSHILRGCSWQASGYDSQFCHWNRLPRKHGSHHTSPTSHFGRCVVCAQSSQHCRVLDSSAAGCGSVCTGGGLVLLVQVRLPLSPRRQRLLNGKAGTHVPFFYPMLDQPAK